MVPGWGVYSCCIHLSPFKSLAKLLCVTPNPENSSYWAQPVHVFSDLDPGCELDLTWQPCTSPHISPTLPLLISTHPIPGQYIQWAQWEHKYFLIHFLFLFSPPQSHTLSLCHSYSLCHSEGLALSCLLYPLLSLSLSLSLSHTHTHTHTEWHTYCWSGQPSRQESDLIRKYSGQPGEGLSKDDQEELVREQDGLICKAPGGYFFPLWVLSYTGKILYIEAYSRNNAKLN